MSTPSAWQKLRYLSGSRAASGDHREWISGVLATRDPRRGVLLAIPNAAIMAFAGLLLLILLGDPIGLLLLGGAGLVLLMGAAVPSVTRRRAAKVAARNGLLLPPR